MQYAVTQDGFKVEAAKGIAASCPTCNQGVIAKCGSIKVHHWAHIAGKDCDSWFEPETEWHRAWKAIFDPKLVEVSVGPHRADIRNADGLVVELQNSPISPEQIQDREQFYGNMIWVVNAENFADRFFLMKRMSERVFSFKWKHMRASWLNAKKPVYLDLGRFSVKDILGGEELEFNEYGERRTIVRIRTWDRILCDSSLQDIPDDERNSGILLLNTAYTGGRGSVQVLTRTQVKLRMGWDPDWT